MMETVDVNVSASGCGAYCSEGTSSWTFDARTGYPIAPRDLLTPLGQIALGQQMTKLATARLKREIGRLEQALAARKPKLERTVEDMRRRLMIYVGCVDNMYGKEKMYANGPGYMVIGDGKLTLRHADCASHSDRALDDLGPFSHTMNAEQLRPNLTAYGKYVLLGDGDGDGRAPATGRHARYFAGTINGTIRMTLYMGNALHYGNATGFDNAHYFYDKYKKRINLAFKRTGNRFELVERDDKNCAGGVLRFELKGDTLVGQWSSNGKTFPFQAKAL